MLSLRFLTAYRVLIRPKSSIALLLVAFGAQLAVAQQPASLTQIDLASGQSLHGTLADPSWKIATRLGELDVPVTSVTALNCQPPPHLGETVVTRDGDELIGRLEDASLKLVSDDGKTADVPIGQIMRLRQTPAASATQPSPPNTGALLYGLRGDYLAVDPPAKIEFQTRWGLLSLRPEQVWQIVFSANGQAAHQIFLSDGSTLSGMMTADALSLKPRNLPGGEVQAPVGELAKLVLMPTTPAEHGAKLTLWGGDVLRGSLTGTLTLQTSYQSAVLNCDEIERISTIADSPNNVTVTLTGKPSVQGAPADASVNCQLNCGLTLSVPAAMIVSYSKSGE